MANINLLPWREERRQELKKEFLTILVASIVLAGLVLFVANRVYSAWIDNQNGRNEYIKRNIDELNRQVTEIKELEDKRRQLLDRMKVIQDLQGTRPLVVHVYDELVRTLPDGVFYQSLTRKDKKLDIVGVAESNNRVSSLMRQLDKSDWLESPNLTSVQAAPDFGEQASAFKMAVMIVPPGEKGAQPDADHPEKAGATKPTGAK